MSHSLLINYIIFARIARVGFCALIAKVKKVRVLEVLDSLLIQQFTNIKNSAMKKS